MRHLLHKSWRNSGGSMTQYCYLNDTGWSAWPSYYLSYFCWSSRLRGSKRWWLFDKGAKCSLLTSHTRQLPRYSEMKLITVLVLDDNKRGKKQQKQKIKQKWNNTSLCILHRTLRKCMWYLTLQKRQTTQGYYSQNQPHILSTVTTQSAPQNKQTAEKLRRGYFLCLGFVVSQSVIAS